MRAAPRHVLAIAAVAQSLASPAAAETIWEKDWHPVFWGLVGAMAALVLLLGAKFAFQALKERRDERERREADQRE